MYSHPSEIMDEITAVTPIYAGMGYDRLEPWGLLWPCLNNEHPGTKILHSEALQEYNFILTKGFL